MWALHAAGIIYGLFLTLSTWVLFYTATHKNFFENNIGMFSLNYRVSNAWSWPGFSRAMVTLLCFSCRATATDPV